ncbi:zinc-binding alcohol dehydrogenase family protein [Microbispora rosea]|uniref:quinone oxidoreductase family protein n=1 Tax=Microbispora rosea TaxID=58117 RepID=UPI00341EE882
MRAIGFIEFGGPDTLHVVDVPEPHAGPGEVRIRVHAAAVNPSDIALRAGHFGPPRDQAPYIPGMDAAGEISEVGEGAPWQVGDKVMALVVPTGPNGGAYADQIVVPAESVVRMPEGADFFAASTLPMNGLTAKLTLDHLDLSPGQTIAVTGAAGVYGGYVVQLAKAAGLRVLADASAADEHMVRDLGADVVVRRGDDVADRIRELCPEGVDGVADGALLNERIAPAVRDGGGMVVLRGWDGDPGRGITVHKVLVVLSVKDTALLDWLRQQAEARAVTPRVARVLPAEQAAEAHRLLEAGGIRGRLVLGFSS